MELSVEKAFILFIFYSFLGWSWETLQYTVEKRRFINRGFLKGPYCPIYGWGALGILAFLGDIKNTIVLFFAGLMLCTILEYGTSYFMEKIFHKRWWDYSSYKYNLNGRVCLLCSVSFGALSVLLIKLVQPVMDKAIFAIPAHLIHSIFIMAFLIYTVDNLYTFYHISVDIREDIYKIIKTFITPPQLSNETVLRISEKLFGGSDDK